MIGFIYHSRKESGLTGIFKKIFALVLAAFSLLSLSGWSSYCTAKDKISPNRRVLTYEALTPSQRYASEILAYLLKVVLGQAGRPEMRKHWLKKGLDADLDFDAIHEVMSDPEQDELTLLVLDPNLLELLNCFNLPSRIPADFDVNRIMDRLQYDKKWRSGKPQWVTIEGVGMPLWGQDLDLKRIEAVLKRIRSRA